MFENLFQLVKIGKELGLSKKEISKVLLFNNTKNPSLYKILLIVAFVALGAVIVFIVVIAIGASNDVYPAGTLYSTVKIEDINEKK